MTRGNQRDKSREKAAKKRQEADKKKGSGDKGANKGMSLEDRRHRDAEIMRQKQLLKQPAAGGGAEGGAQGAEGGASK